MAPCSRRTRRRASPSSCRRTARRPSTPRAGSRIAGRSRLRPILPFRTLDVARHLVAVLDALALRRGKPGWIEKTPMHLRRIALIEEAAGGAPRPHFVHVIRNGVDVASSLHQASRGWERPYDLRASAARWNRDVALSLGRIGSPVDHFVFYEDIVARPEPAIRRLLAALGLEWESEVLERYAETAARVTTAGEAWKAGTAAEIRPSTAAGQSLSASDRERLARWLRSGLYDALRAQVAATREGPDERA